MDNIPARIDVVIPRGHRIPGIRPKESGSEFERGYSYELRSTDMVCPSGSRIRRLTESNDVDCYRFQHIAIIG
jgi:hypothetical protein